MSLESKLATPLGQSRVESLPTGHCLCRKDFENQHQFDVKPSIFEPRHEKSNNVSEQVRHKPTQRRWLEAGNLGFRK